MGIVDDVSQKARVGILRKKEWFAMHKSYRKILEVLARHRKPVSVMKLAQEIGAHNAGLSRPLKALAEQSFVVREKAGRESHIAITKQGREYLRFNPVLSDEIAERDPVQDKYADAQRLWMGLGLNNGIVLSSDPVKVGSLDLPGGIRRFEDMESATRYVNFRRNRTNVWFTPASTRTKHRKNRTEKVFEWSHALWLDLDFKRDEKGYPQPETKRRQRLTEALQNIVNDNLAVFAIVDSGAGYHIYFKVQNKIKNTKRLEKALKGLAQKYAGDERTAHPTANLRVPGSVNIKKFETRTIRLHCKLIDIKPTNLCRLADVERVLGYNWLEDKGKAVQKQKVVSDKAEPNQDVPQTKPKKGGWANIERMIKDGYDEAYRSDLSRADYYIMCEGIRRGHKKETILGWFTEPENAICIFHRNKANRDTTYLDITYEKALKAVKAKSSSK
jgi:predicted transcriptional regulator